MTQLDRLIVGDGEYVSYRTAVRAVETANCEIQRQRYEIERLRTMLRSVYERAPWMHDVRDVLKDEQKVDKHD
jgi:hypothetical protein